MSWNERKGNTILFFPEQSVVCLHNKVCVCSVFVIWCVYLIYYLLGDFKFGGPMFGERLINALVWN